MSNARSASRRRRAIALVAGCVAVLGVAGIVTARLVDVRATLGLRDVPLTLSCRASNDVRLPAGHASRAGRWRAIPDAPFDADELRAAAARDRIYVGSGLEQTEFGGEPTSTDSFFSFHPAAGTYDSVLPLPERADHTAVVSAGGSLYVIGGYRDALPVSDVFRFTPSSGRWEALAPLGVPRGSPSAAVIGKRIYVAGGSTLVPTRVDVEATRSLEIYDIKTGEWKKGPDMPTPRHHAGAAAVGGKLYVVGGRRHRDLSVDAAERFDPETGDWERIPQLPLGSGGLSVVGAAGKVLAIGGGDDDLGKGWVTPATWAFDPARERWQRLADLRVARHGHASAAIGRTVYTFGGSPCVGFGGTTDAEALDLGR